MPRDIPGFVFDAERGRYFRVQENHQHTQHVADRSMGGSGSAASNIAITNTITNDNQSNGRTHGSSNTITGRTRGGVGARYTREVVNAQKRLREFDGSRRQRRKQDRERSHARESYSTSASQGQLSTGLNHQHRPLSQSIPSHTQPRRSSTRRLAHEPELLLRLGTCSSRTELINTRYALSLARRSLTQTPNTPAANVSPTAPLAGAHTAIFAVDTSTKHLYATASPRGLREFSVTEPVRRANATATDDSECDGAIYARGRITPILNTEPLSAVAVASPGCVVWATHGFDAGPLFSEVPAVGGNGASTMLAADERATVHVSTRYADQGVDVPWGDWREDFGEWGTQRFEIMGAGTGVGRVWDIRAGKEEGRVALGTSEGVMVWNLGAEGGVGEGMGLVKGMGAVCVGWKDERVWLAGGRDGGVRLGDVREKKAVVARLKHGGAVCRVEGMQPRCDWGVLVWGLERSAVYDLRWTKDMPVGAGRHANGGRSRQAKPPTKPLYDFDIPPARIQRQYGMGFAFDPEAGIVAAAFPFALGQTRVGLWDAISGKMLDSPLTRHSYGPVQCMQYVDLEGDGSGPKSLLVGEQLRTTKLGGLDAWD